MQPLESEFHSANDGSVTEKKKSIPCQCFCRCTATTKYAVLVKETLHFQRGGSCHDSTHTILHTPALFLYDLDQVQLEKKFLERLYRLCGKG